MSQSYLVGFAQGQVSLGRLCKFLSCSEIEPEWTTKTLLLSENRKEEPPLSSATVNYLNTRGMLADNSEGSEDVAIILENAAFSWSHSLVENCVSVISQISLAIPTGSLVVIIGKVCMPFLAWVSFPTKPFVMR